MYYNKKPFNLVLHCRLSLITHVNVDRVLYLFCQFLSKVIHTVLNSFISIKILLNCIFSVIVLYFLCVRCVPRKIAQKAMIYIEVKMRSMHCKNRMTLKQLYKISQKIEKTIRHSKNNLIYYIFPWNMNQQMVPIFQFLYKTYVLFLVVNTHLCIVISFFNTNFKRLFCCFFSDISLVYDDNLELSLIPSMIDFHI